MTNPTLERAARAVSDAFPLTNGDDAYAQPLQFKLGDKTCLEIARAVLMAVREPDSEIVIAEGDKHGWNNAPTPEAFTAMIDAILAEGE